MKWPRWANALFRIVVVCIVFGTVVAAHRRGYDIPRTLGFFWSRMWLVVIAVVVCGLLINSAVLIIELIQGRVRLPALSSKEKRMATAFIIAIAINAGCAAFILWHPLGWIWSVVVSVAAYLCCVSIQVRIFRGFSEAELHAFQDRILAAKQEPNPLYFIP
jgi:hypothetical protein